MYLTLAPEIKTSLSPDHLTFEAMMQLNGKIYRALENRRTLRISLAQQSYFIKQHFGIGWKEIFKNLFQGRLPIVSASNEFLAIKHLQHLQINTQEVLGYGHKGLNPATRQSFIITRELPPFITLEDLTQTWQTSPPTFKLKISLIQEVAAIACRLHQGGVNHRDFYICHFLLNLLEYSHQSIKIYLIDLHRAQIRKRTPKRWVIKDLAGLYFSTKDIGLTQRDLLRFMRFYRKKPLRELLNKETTFWWKVIKRGNKLYRKHASST